MGGTPYVNTHEVAVLTTLIGLRGKYPIQSHVTTGIEEITEDFLNITDPALSIDAILNITLPQDQPESYQLPIQSWCMGLRCVASLIKSSKPETLEREMKRLGRLAVRSLEAEDSEVRKSCVSMCVELHAKVGDETKLFETVLEGLGQGQQNLLTYYFAKNQKA